MTVNVILPGQERKIVYVHIPPNGDPKPCYEDALGYAYQSGYVRCDAPGSLPTPNPLAVSPDETDADRSERHERAEDARYAKAEEQREALGLTHMPHPECPICGGVGIVVALDQPAYVPCSSCYPEGSPLGSLPLEGEVPTLGAADAGGGDNEGAILGMPADVTTVVTVSGSQLSTTTTLDPSTPASCNMAGCAGLCGICPPPKKVTVREGRELNRNRRARGFDPLKIDGGKVKGGA